MQVEIPISDVLTAALGKELAKARIDAGKTQLEVSQAADITPGYLSQLEHGRMVSYELLRAVCKAIKVSPVELARRITQAHTGKPLAKKADALAALFTGLEEVL